MIAQSDQTLLQRFKMSKKKAITDKSVRNENGDIVHGLVSLDGLYENWFLDYASYVILERAVPRIEDGLKPVQRRIMHSLKEMDDGRFNKLRTSLVTPCNITHTVMPPLVKRL